MGETAGNALIQKVIDDLVDTIVKECTYIYNFQRNVQNVEAKVGELVGVESDVDQEIDVAMRGSKKIGEDIKRWKKEVTKIKNKSCNVLNGANKVNSGFLKGRMNVPQRFLLSRKAAQLNADFANFLVEGRKHIKLEHGAVPAGLLPASIIHSDDLESRIILTDQVMVALQNEEIYLIGICGMAGVGKTRLADEVIRRVLEDKLFDAAVKVEVSEVLNIKLIQSVIAQNIGLGVLEEIDENGRARKLRNRLTDGSKNLVILDNIWNTVPLDRIGLPRQGEEKGCKVIFTTRNTYIPWDMKAEKIDVETLSNSEARLLFKNIARIYVEDIANKVADECGGLPLAIDVVASALGNRRPEVWESTLNQLKKSTATKEFNMEELVYSRIKLSYDLLEGSDSEAQRLLLLCCLFPEGADIPDQKLVRYVMGLQLSETSDNLVNTSNRVFKLLDDLKNHSLLLRGDTDMTVKMNHIVRDVCLSISSKDDRIRLKVKHEPKLMQWPDEKEQRPPTGISLTFDDKMKQLPDGLVYHGLELLQLQFNCDSLDIPIHFFNNFKEVRVLDFKRMTLWGKFIQIVALPPALEFLTNLRTLCLEFWDLSSWNLSQIESLKQLEVLSFYSSKLVSLPSQIKQLTNLKLLDLRCADGPDNIPSCILPALTKLEDLYLGNFDSWSERTPGQGVNITELSSLSFLSVLQIRVKDPQLLLELMEESWFERLRRFQIAAIRQKISFRQYEIGKSIIFDAIKWNSLLDSKISSLLSSTESLTLKATSFKNLFAECSSLQILDLYEGKDVKFIMEAGDSANTLNKLKRMDIQSMEDLKALCNGDLPGNSLIELETVKLDSLPELTHVWSAPVGSGCLVNLRVFEMSYCDALTCIFPFSVAEGLVQLVKLDIKCCKMLKWIVSGEAERTSENIVLKKLSFLSLDELPSFRGFFPDLSLKTLIENSATVEVNPLANENAENHETQCCGCCFTRKRQASCTEESPVTNALAPNLNDLRPEAPVVSPDNTESNLERLFNQLVELPSLNRLLIGSMNNLEHIVDDQTSRVSVSKIRSVIVASCENLLSLAASDYSIRSLQYLEKVNVENCASMQSMFAFRKRDVDSPSAAPMLNKLETVTLLNLSSLKHVFRMVPEETPCFKNLRSLEISNCSNLTYVFSVSAAKMLGNLQDLKVKGSGMVEEIIVKEEGNREATDIIQFPHLRILQLESLDCLTSFSSVNRGFEFPRLRDLLVRECPSMKRFCRGQVEAFSLEYVRVGEDRDQRVKVIDGLNSTIQKLNAYRSSSSSSSSSRRTPQLGLAEIQAATDNFHPSRIIRREEFAITYKAVLNDGRVVAVKRFDSKDDEYFRNEVDGLETYKNDKFLVSLIATCRDSREMIIVHEFMLNGTLADYLHSRDFKLSWNQLLKICLDVAFALEFLHSQKYNTSRIIQRNLNQANINPANIWLDENWGAKISDFGLAKIGPANTGQSAITADVKGSFSHLDLYYNLTGSKLNKRTDTYAFGVVMFEVLCWRPAFDKQLKLEEQMLAKWAQTCFRNGSINDIIDPRLKAEASQDCLKDFAQLAYSCLLDNPNARPKMSEVVEKLNSILRMSQRSRSGFR